MIFLTRQCSQLRCILNAISVTGASSAKTNKIINNHAQYHWANRHKAEHRHWQAAQQYAELKKYQRTLSTLRNHSAPMAARVTASKDDRLDFMATFPDVVRELSEVVESHKIPEVVNWFTRALQYNVPRGKKNRGLLTVLAYKSLVKADELTAENLKLSQYLGWCVEMLQCFFILADDIMDNSTTRRGQLCWHKLEDVGLIAINDALMIENGIYELLAKKFRHLDCYVDLLELFHKISFFTTFGQSMDLLNANENISSFTMEKYNSIVMNKTSYYTFYLPVALALHLAGVKDQEAFRQSKTILLEMGNLFQVQDDFLDCFGDSDVTGKIGTDIQDNKCSWLAVKCMQLASPEMKAIMQECYGQNDSEKIARVQQLYEELGIASIYARYEEETYNNIKTLIQQSSPIVPHEIFFQLLNKIYQRTS